MFHRTSPSVGMGRQRSRPWSILMAGALVSLLLVLLTFLVAEEPSHAAVPIGFGRSTLHNETSTRPTSLQFGPDGRLYVAQQNGLIKIYTIKRNGTNNYSVTATNNISSVRNIPNHNDGGALNSHVTDRQVTGILVRGTATNPVIYVTSSDPRIGGVSQFGDNGDVNLDTNSGVLSRLKWTGSNWSKVDLVRGLPRSEENHSPNGLQLDPSTNTLYIAEGGNTNMGAPSYNFALLPEYALSAAILKVDLDAIGDTTYDLPTLNDEDRAGNPDANDPFGGNDGKNQAKLVSGGPVQIYEPGFRNAYDLLIAKSGKMYTIDNSSNAGGGDVPVKEGTPDCTNQRHEPGTTQSEALHLVKGPGYYGGHPNPTRGNKSNTFNANGQSPVTTANPVECNSRTPGAANGALATFSYSTNGLTEYTASNFGGAMKGNLLAASFEEKIYRIKLNSTGDAVVTKQALFSSVGSRTLDVTAQGDSKRFPGTIWAAEIDGGTIKVFEPNDYGGSGGGSCNPADDPNLDSDGDGYSNADEIDNGTNPCSSADRPPDYDGDKISNLNDPDDDNDSLPDTSDPFAVDPNNGTTTSLPVSYTWDNDAPNPGGLLDLGFTGLMTNGSANYETLYNPAKMTAGGAPGVVTVDAVPDGDAWSTRNTQKYGFQFGVNADPATTNTFTVHTRMQAPFAGRTPEDYQSMGLFIGNGNQDDYVKLVTAANAAKSGSTGIEFLKEVNGSVALSQARAEELPGPDTVDLFLTVDPDASTVRPSYVVTTNGKAEPPRYIGDPVRIPAGWFDGPTGFAVGIISTSAGPAPVFPATWEFIEVTPEPQ